MERTLKKVPTPGWQVGCDGINTEGYEKVDPKAQPFKKYASNTTINHFSSFFKTVYEAFAHTRAHLFVTRIP